MTSRRRSPCSVPAAHVVYNHCCWINIFDPDPFFDAHDDGGLSYGHVVVMSWSCHVMSCSQMIKCSVCQDKKKNRVITKCFHMFCDGCLEKSIKVRKGKEGARKGGRRTDLNSGGGIFSCRHFRDYSTYKRMSNVRVCVCHSKSSVRLWCCSIVSTCAIIHCVLLCVHSVSSRYGHPIDRFFLTISDIIVSRCVALHHITT